ncbi:MAG TPA: hypothetical protein VKA73_08965 [Rubrobacter sp.]|nr:hypothetical protein [Rubrobacter sp.]
MGSATRRASTADSSGRTTLWGAGLIGLIGLIHLLVVPEYFEFGAYLGLLFIANFLGSAASAVGIYRRAWWGWPLGLVMAVGAFVMYVESRTIGLPGLNEGWLDPPGVLSLILEALFVALYLRGASRDRGSQG